MCAVRIGISDSNNERNYCYVRSINQMIEYYPQCNFCFFGAENTDTLLSFESWFMLSKPSQPQRIGSLLSTFKASAPLLWLDNSLPCDLLAVAPSAKKQNNLGGHF